MSTFQNQVDTLKARDDTGDREILLGPYGVSGFTDQITSVVSLLASTTMRQEISKLPQSTGLMQLLVGATISFARVTVSSTSFNCFVIPAGRRIHDIFIDLREGMTACDAVIGTSASIALFGSHDVSLSVGGRLRPTFTKIMLSVMDTSLAADTTIQCNVSISGTTDPASGSFVVKAVIY